MNRKNRTNLMNDEQSGGHGSEGEGTPPPSETPPMGEGVHAAPPASPQGESGEGPDAEADSSDDDDSPDKK